MELYDEEVNKKKVSNPKKLILIALILCIFLLVFLLTVIIIFKNKNPKTITLSINNSNIKIQNNMLITDESGNTIYVSLKQLARLLGYDYIEGEYLQKDNKESSAEKCYLQGTKQIIGFEENSKKIYKTSLSSSLDFQYLKLNNNIIKKEDSLYIALEDLNTGCNVICYYSKEKNKIEINTLDNAIEQYKEYLKTKSINVSEKDFNNEKALLYGSIIVSDSTGKFGLIDFKYNQKIGFIYDSIEFDEPTQSFIVSNNNKYGVVNEDGKILIKLSYSEMEIINNTPLYYKVKSNNKYGVINQEGDTIVNKEYDKIGISNKSSNSDIILIKNIGDNNLTGIVVCNNKQYGIVDVKNKKEIIECSLDDIYFVEKENGEIEYYIKKDNNSKKLNDYIRELNTTVVDF